jgi:hypothetical protein
VTDVNVGLNAISHALPDSLDVLLRGPSGRTLVLMSDVIATNQIGIALSITLDDEASSGWLTPTTLYPSGTYRPSDQTFPDLFPPPAPQHWMLSAFDGGPASGVWSLFVVDDSEGYGGSISSWSLTITAKV